MPASRHLQLRMPERGARFICRDRSQSYLGFWATKNAESDAGLKTAGVVERENESSGDGFGERSSSLPIRLSRLLFMKYREAGDVAGRTQCRAGHHQRIGIEPGRVEDGQSTCGDGSADLVVPAAVGRSEEHTS